MVHGVRVHDHKRLELGHSCVSSMYCLSIEECRNSQVGLSELHFAGSSYVGPFVIITGSNPMNESCTL